MSVLEVVFGIYFVLLFGLAWYGLRRTQDASDYWIAGGKLGWLVGGSTIAATHASAGTFIGTIGVIYTVGWSFGWLVLSVPLAYWFMAAVLAPRFTRFQELTLPAYLDRRYESRGVRGVSAVIIMVATVVFIQAQIVGGGLIANIVFGIPVTWGMVGFTAFLLAYTVVGGMVAVVYTDFIQLLVMALGAVLAVPLAIRHIGSVDDVLVLSQAINPDAFSWGALPGTLLFTMGLAFMLGSVATPEKLIRLYAMKDMRTIRRGILFAVIAITVMNLLVFVTALASMVLFPALVSGDMAMPVVARAVLPTFIGAIMLAAITSAMMSTVDSLLIVAGSALSHDIYQTLIHPESSKRSRVLVGRVGTFVVGTVPLILLLSGVGEGELIQFIVLLFTALMGASFFIPVVLGVIWRRGTKHGAVAAMVGGVTVTFLWNSLGDPAIDPVLPGFLASAILMVSVSLMTRPPSHETVERYFGDPA